LRAPKRLGHAFYGGFNKNNSAEGFDELRKRRGTKVLLGIDPDNLNDDAAVMDAGLRVIVPQLRPQTVVPRRSRKEIAEAEKHERDVRKAEREVEKAEARKRNALTARATGPAEDGEDGPDGGVWELLGIADAAAPAEKVRASGGNR